MKDECLPFAPGPDSLRLFRLYELPPPPPPPPPATPPVAVSLRWNFSGFFWKVPGLNAASIYI